MDQRREAENCSAEEQEEMSKDIERFVWTVDDVDFMLEVPEDEMEEYLGEPEEVTEGGQGSGNYGHSGRPGEVGGSGEGGGPTDRISKATGKSKKEIERDYGKRIKGYTTSEEKRVIAGIPDEVKNRSKEFPDPAWRAVYGFSGLSKAPAPKDVVLQKDTSKQRQGKCYEYAARFIIDNEGWDLVHATLYPRMGPFEDKIYFHGFAVKDNTVYDPVFNDFYDKDSYYKYYSITDERKFERYSAMKRLYKERNYGPWE